MSEMNSDELDALIEYMIPLVKSCLGSRDAHQLKEVMFDLKTIINSDLVDSDDETALENRIRIYGLIKIACSYYTLGLESDKMTYWEACRNRNLKGELEEDKVSPDLIEGFNQTFSVLDEFDRSIVILKIRYNASDFEISKIVSIEEVEINEFINEAMSLFYMELKKQGFQIEE